MACFRQPLIALTLAAQASLGWGQEPGQHSTRDAAKAAAQTPGRVAPAGTAGEQGPRWSTLTPAQRVALAPLQQDWHTIDASRKQKWLQVAGRMPSMAQEERQRITERMAEWARMSPQERGRARLQFLEAKRIPAEDRAARWEAYQALDPEKREALASRAAASGVASSSAGSKATSPEPKRNVVGAAGVPAARTVAPTVIQVRPGATTTLVSREVRPPKHQQPGQPKIAAASDAVDPATLLPRRGPQAPFSATASSAAAGASRPLNGKPEAQTEPDPSPDP